MTDVDVQDSEDGTQYVMTVKQKDNQGGESSKEVRFSKYTDDDKVVVNIDLTDSGGAGLPASQYLALGSGFVVKYSVGVGTAGGGTVDGYSDLKARVIVKRGSTVISEFRDAEFVGVTAGQSYTFDASPYLKDATAYTVQVEAQATYQDGTLMKTATAKVTMVAMELETTYSAGNGLADGGYKNDVNIPFTAKGTSGEKNIYYRVNGGQAFTLGLSAGSGVQQKNVTIPLTQMQEGTNVVEAYAQHENSGVVSRVHYITLLKAGGGVTAYAGLMFSHRAAGFQRDWKHPVLEAEQFTAWNFTYAGYDRDAYTARVKVTDRGSVVKEDLLQRGETGSYGRTNVNVEPLDYRVSCGDAVLEVQVNTTSHPDIEATLAPDAVCTFDAFGRSNTENNPASWVSGDKRMEFRDVLWSVNEYGAGSGWHKDRLLLAGGAGMTLTADGGYRPFNEADKPEGFAIRDVGMTLEIEYSTANVTDTDAELITCLGQLDNGNRYGLIVTPEEAKFLTGVVTEAMDAGQVLRYEDSVGTKFQPGTNIRITYVFYPNVQTNEQRTLIGFYVNGEESAASKWLDKVNFDIQSQLEFKSAGADLNVKSVRIYNKALTSDEVLNNYIVDRNHLEDADGEPGVRSLDEDNRVLNEGDTCVKEEDFYSTETENIEQVSIELFTRLRSFDTPVSRAIALEDDVDKDPWILVFTGGDGTAGNAVFAEAAQANINVGNKSYVLLRPQSGKSWVLILANPQDKFYVGSMSYDFSVDNFNDLFTNKTLTNVTALLSAMPMTAGVVVNAPPFVNKMLPMSYLYEATEGINVNTKIGTSTVPLELTRAVAKIVVKSTVADFTLSGIHSVYNMNKNTVLHNLSGNLETAASMVDYIRNDANEDFVSATANVTDPIYVYEAKSGTGAYMIIRAFYKGLESYYKIAIADDELKYIDIKRNHEYRFTIISANFPGFGSYTDALLAEPNNLALKCKVEIIDLSSFEIKANSEYYLAVSNRLCMIYDDINSEHQYLAFTLTTNCTYAHKFSDKSNYIRVTNGTMTIVAPASQRISSASDPNTPFTVDVVVKLPTGSIDNSSINIKLGNIEQKVSVIRKDIIPAAGMVVNYYTQNSGIYDFDYYLLSAKTDTDISWITMKNKYGGISGDPNSIQVGDGIIDIDIASASSARNAVVYLTTIKNPKEPLEDDKDIPKRIKIYFYQNGS